MKKRAMFQAVADETLDPTRRPGITLPLLSEELTLIDKRVKQAGFEYRTEYIRTLIFVDLRNAGFIPEEDVQ